MERIYEGMFLIDNAVVREDWNRAKSVVTDILEKHGATILSARRWDERRLAYPIKGKNRATFLLAYYNLPTDQIPAMRRDFELTETVLRSLEVVVSAVPESEAECVSAEAVPEFKVPTPPDDDHIDFVEEPDDYGRGPREDSRDSRRGRDTSSAGGVSDTESGSYDTKEEPVSASEDN